MKQLPRPLCAVFVLMAAAGASVLLLSCAGVQRTVTAPPPFIEGASFVGNKTCYECHTNITRSFPSSPHSRLHFVSP